MALLGDIKIMMLKGEKGDKGDGSYDDTEIRGMIAQETADREEEIAEMERNFLNYLYPVGSIYMTVGTTSPAVLFGGTWVQIKDCFLLSAGDTYSNGSTGGSATHTPQGTVDNHTLTVAEIPYHYHATQQPTRDSGSATDDSGQSVNVVTVASGQTSWQSGVQLNPVTHEAEGDNPHNHGFTGTAGNYMPPYLTVNVWKRTA